MKQEAVFIPELPSELTVDWLNTVLPQAARQARITDVHQSILGEGEGFVGDIIQLHLSYAEPNLAQPQTVIAKMPKLANRAMGELLGAYERENMFYMTLGQDLPVPIPELYYGEFDRDAASEKQEEILRQVNKIPNFLQGLVSRLGWFIAARKNRRYILLLEDISSATPCDQLAGVDRSTYEKILTEVARLHAAFWASSKLEGQFFLLPMDVDVEMRHQMMVRARAAYENLFPDVIAAGMSGFLDEVERDGPALCHQLCTGPVTLLHGDLRLDNLFLRGEEVVFIDWQLVRRGPPMYDIAYLLSCGITDQESARGLIEVYHQALVGAGVQDYDLEDAFSDYKVALKMVLMNLSSVDQVDLGDGRGISLLSAWMDRLLMRLQADSS